MSVIGKVLLILLSLVVSGVSKATGEEGPRGFLRDLNRTLDFGFGIVITGFLSWKIGLLAIKPLEARGYDAIGPLIVALLMLGLKAVLFVLLPTIFLCMFLRRFESLLPRLVVYGVVSLVGAGIYYAAQKNAEAQALRLAQEKAAEEAARQQLQREALTMEMARVNAVQREAEELKSSQSRLLDLRNQARDRWRTDLQAAGAFGGDGEVPPMLRVFQNGPYEVKVTNAGPNRACVKLVRSMRKPGTDIYLRCPADLFRDCQEIPSRATVTFYMQFDERSPACREQRYEFRVGTPLKPEPSWWTNSALAQFDERPPDMREPVISDEILVVRSEIAKLEKWLSR
jgi:hypothetical protein